MDIAVIGAGITVVRIAYQLAVDGRQAVVIDDGDISGGNTGARRRISSAY